MTRCTLTFVALLLTVAPVVASVQTPEEICTTTLTFEGELDSELLERCVAASTADGVPAQLLRELEQEAYRRHTRRGIFLQTFQHMEVSQDGTTNYSRSRFRLFPEAGKWGWYAEVEVADGLTNTNWLQQIWLSRKVGEVEARFGRNFSGPGHNTHFPGGFYTASYPTSVYPWGFHFWGVQLVRDNSKSILVVDLGGPTGYDFNDNAVTDSLEWGFMYRRKFSVGYVGTAMQTFGGSLRTGVNFDGNVGRLGLAGGVFHTDETAGRVRDWTGLVTANLTVTSLGDRGRLLLVGQQEWRKDATDPTTFGVGVQADPLYFVVDHGEDDGWGTRIQYLVKLPL